MKKFEKLYMGYFKIERPDFRHGSTRVNPTGNPQKHFFLKYQQISSINQDWAIGRMNKKLLSCEKRASLYAAPLCIL